MKNCLKILLATGLALSLALPVNVSAAAKLDCIDSGIAQEVYAVGQYSNWDGVSTVSQFSDEKGQFCFAYKNGDKITVVKTKNGKVNSKKNLTMKGNLFGAVTCDSDGYLYAVTGKGNEGTDTSKETVFITKYDKKGKLVKTVGDNGRSSLADYYGDDFNTRIPFDAGNCDAAINGHYLAVDYGRTMYNGHQSNSVWMIDTDTMKTVTPSTNDYYGYSNYQSHSFGQRAIPFEEGFAFMSEGDCYDRSFTFSMADIENANAKEQSVFDFWVQKGTLDSYDMFVLNDNFAHIGDLCDLGNGTITFVASSVKSLDKNAANESEQIFVQIFDPTKDLSSQAAYVTTGKRSGTGGPNGNEAKTDYGVKWLTKYKEGMISDPQAVCDEDGNTIVLFERYKNYDYLGLYCMKLDQKGKITQKAKCISKTAVLNSCETPVYSDGYVYWCANEYQRAYEGSDALKVYKLKV